MPKSKIILRNSSLNKLLIVFPPTFVVDTKILNGYNFVAPLSLYNKKIQ